MKISQAAAIAVNCIRQALGFQGEIAAETTLKTCGLVGTPRKISLINRIVNDKNIGVLSVNHTIDPKFLTDLKAGWTVGFLTTTIHGFSVSNGNPPAVIAAIKEAQEK